MSILSNEDPASEVHINQKEVEGYPEVSSNRIPRNADRHTCRVSEENSGQLEFSALSQNGQAGCFHTRAKSAISPCI